MTSCPDCGGEKPSDKPLCAYCDEYWATTFMPLPPRLVIDPERATREVADIVELSPAERAVIHSH